MFASFLDAKLTAAQAERWATTAALIVATFLVALKTAGYLGTGSVSLLSSLIDSASDVVASLITYIGVRTALRPADEGHRYGHGKAEAMAALGTAAFVLGSASFMTIEALGRFVSPQPLVHTSWGVAIMLISLVPTYALVCFQRYVSKRSGSTAIAADSVHYMADFVQNGAVIASLLITHYSGYVLVDALFGIAVAAWLVLQIIPVAKQAIDMLMDHELPEEDRISIGAVAAKHPQVLGVHDMRTRRAGSDIFIELHLEFQPNMQLLHVHAIGMQIEQELHRMYKGSDVVIHFDPAGIEEPRRDDVLEAD